MFLTHETKRSTKIYLHALKLFELPLHSCFVWLLGRPFHEAPMQSRSCRVPTAPARRATESRFEKLKCTGLRGALTHLRQTRFYIRDFLWPHSMYLHTLPAHLSKDIGKYTYVSGWSYIYMFNKNTATLRDVYYLPTYLSTYLRCRHLIT